MLEMLNYIDGVSVTHLATHPTKLYDIRYHGQCGMSYCGIPGDFVYSNSHANKPPCQSCVRVASSIVENFKAIGVEV